MCIINEMQQAVDKHDLTAIRKVVSQFRQCGLGYVRISRMFYTHCDLEHVEFDNLMQEIDHMVTT